ncbi:MAG TPA: cytochrome c oxidase subunit II, partial [Pseudorhizobium sp.]|nr:cytochrome c oxidase subunit II [Pseudorhizobium sp.]
QWEFRYPTMEGGPSTVGILHIPAGRTIEVAVESADVIHSFWIPRLAGKIDAVPGHTNYLRLRADRPGRYGGQCSEYCGVGHAAMDFEVRAHAAEDYESALGLGGTQ